MKTYASYIGGAWVSNDCLCFRPSPLDGSELIVPESTLEDVESAAKVADDAKRIWANTSCQERISYAAKLAELLATDNVKGSIVEVIQKEVGKPLIEAQTEIDEALDIINYFLSNLEKFLEPQKNEIDKELWPNVYSLTFLEPKGVVAFVKSWNYPFSNPLWGIIPAILAGNVVIYKPSELAGNTGIILAKMIHNAGFPEGVFNLLTGGPIVGQELVKSKFIDMVSFTGSISTGRKIHVECATRGKSCSLELGGNDVAIVTETADISLSASGITWGAFTNAGQVCTGIKRVLVQKSVKKHFVEAVKDETLRLSRSSDISPLITEERAIEIEGFIADAIENGGVVITGGSRTGAFIEATIIDNCSQKMRLFKEEAFGPLMPIYEYESPEEAALISNSTNFGLGASVWLSDEKQIDFYRKELDVGMVWINEVNMPFPQAPWSGRKQSGPGVELSKHGFKQFCNTKHLCIEKSGSKRSWWFPYSS